MTINDYAMIGNDYNPEMMGYDERLLSISIYEMIRNYYK